MINNNNNEEVIPQAKNSAKRPDDKRLCDSKDGRPVCPRCGSHTHRSGKTTKGYQKFRCSHCLTMVVPEAPSHPIDTNTEPCPHCHSWDSRKKSRNRRYCKTCGKSWTLRFRVQD